MRPSLLGALAFSLVVALASCTAEAAITPAGPAVEVLGNGWRVLEPTSIGAIPASNRTWSASGAGVHVADGIGIAGKAGNLPVVATRVAPWAIVGGAVARCMAMVNPYCAAGSAAYMVWDAYRVKPDGAGGLKSDPGTAPAQQQQTMYQAVLDCFHINGCSPNDGTFHRTAFFSTAAEAVAALPASIQSWPTPNEWTATRVYTPPYGCVYKVGADVVRTCTVFSAEQQVNGCPASIDPLDSAYNVPAGSPVGPDGRCPTARYYHQPITPDAAGQKWSLFPPGPSMYPNVIQASKDAVSSGQPLVNNPMSITGPASQTGTPTTTNDGTNTTTTTPTYVYNYAGDTITYNTTVTTTTTNNSTQQTTNTTTTTNPAPTPTDTPTDCDKYPDTIACMKVGEAPTDAVPKVTKNVDFQAEVVTLPEGCPADVALPNGHVLSYAPTCAAFEMARPIVIAAAAVASMLMVVFALRGQ